MALTYQSWLGAIRAILVAPANGSEAAFEAFVPRIIEYTELRLCRDFNFLATNTTDTTVSTVSGTRSVTLPSTFVVLDAMNVLSPAASTVATGTRVPLQRVSLDFMNLTWPTVATTGTPSRYAMLTDTSVQLSPTPNGAFLCEFIGTARPTPLSPSVSSNFMSTYLPDLYLAASVVIGAGYRQNYGVQSDDPKLAMSWEAVYQGLKASAQTEEARKKAAAQVAR